jgi:hypothetical protein
MLWPNAAACEHEPTTLPPNACCAGHDLSELTCDYTLPQLAGLLPRFPSLTTLQLRADNLSAGEWPRFEADMAAAMPKLSGLLSFKIRLPAIDRDAAVPWRMPDALTSLRVLGDCSLLRLEAPGGSLRVLETELDSDAGVWALLAANPNLTELSADSLGREVSPSGWRCCLSDRADCGWP